MFDFSQVPFSRAYSFTCLAYGGSFHKESISNQSVWYKLVKGGDLTEHLGYIGEFFLADKHGNSLDFTVELQPSCLRLVADSGYVEFIILKDEKLIFQCHNVCLHLFRHAKQYEYVQAATSSSFRMLDTALDHKFIIHKQHNMDVKIKEYTNDQDILCQEICFIPAAIDKTAQASIQATKFGEINEENNDFLKEKKLIKKEFTSWKQENKVKQYPLSWQLAQYILWSCIVPAEGYLTEPSVYMSKNHMINIWAWDNCFVAFALMKKHPDLAFAQLKVLLDQQTKHGCIPDFVNDQYAYFSFMKPPIYGWASLILMQKNPDYFTDDKLQYLYDKISKLTHFWLNDCSLFQPNFPEYFHGNDSGWDNSSIFHKGGPLYSPDLATFLILQIDFLHDIAIKLNKSEQEILDWKKTAELLYHKLCKILLKDNYFVAKKADTGEEVQDSQSLILLLPLLLRERLSDETKAALIRKLDEDFLHRYGLVTEAISSPFFDAKGYWLGPIWAPTNYLFYQALLVNNQTDMAERLAKGYLSLLEKSNMAENHNPLTGEGLCDTAFAWTSAVYLLFYEYLYEK